MNAERSLLGLFCWAASAAFISHVVSLAFTKIEKRKPDRKDGQAAQSEGAYMCPSGAVFEGIAVEVFESALAEIQPKGECYSLNIASTRLQRVQVLMIPVSGFVPMELMHTQFLHCDAKSTYLLFLLDKEFVHLYQIFTRRRQKGGCVRLIVVFSISLSSSPFPAVSGSQRSLSSTLLSPSSSPGMIGIPDAIYCISSHYDLPRTRSRMIMSSSASTCRSPISCCSRSQLSSRLRRNRLLTCRFKTQQRCVDGVSNEESCYGRSWT